MTIYIDNAGISATVTDTATGRSYSRDGVICSAPRSTRPSSTHSPPASASNAPGSSPVNDVIAPPSTTPPETTTTSPQESAGTPSLQAHSTSTYTKPSHYGTPNEISCTNRKPRERGAMSTQSSIEWTETTWNPTTGCDRVSAGCDHCYALILAKRLKAMGSAKYRTDGDPRTSGPGFGIATHDHALGAPC
jgi:Protein of unknown function (DUF5131)